MASLLTYRLLSETPEQVAYAFGSSPEDMTGQVVLDPRDLDRTPTGQGDAAGLQTVARRVTLRRLREGSWPTGGSIQS